jgi:hypothetical protein
VGAEPIDAALLSMEKLRDIQDEIELVTFQFLTSCHL